MPELAVGEGGEEAEDDGVEGVAAGDVEAPGEVGGGFLDLGAGAEVTDVADVAGGLALEEGQEPVLRGGGRRRRRPDGGETGGG